MPDAGMRTPAAKSDRADRTDALPSLVVALDLPDADQALRLAGSLKPFPLWVKVGLELFTAEGPVLVRRLLDESFMLFLDLKFHDIPNTVQRATCRVTALGAHMTTVHLCGGEAMCRAAVEGRRRGRALRPETAYPGKLPPDTTPLLMGITVLTSEAGRESDIRDTVIERALTAKTWGLDGVVCSGREASAVKAACGKDFFCLCPGIRFPDAAPRDDQARVCSPYQAALAGADFLVMGRPVLDARRPAAAVRAALDGIERASRERQHSSQATFL